MTGTFALLMLGMTVLRGPACPPASSALEHVLTDVLSQQPDTFDVARFLVSRGYRLERVLPSWPPYYAAIVVEPSGASRAIVTVRREAESATVLAGAVPLGELVPISQWIALSDTLVSGGVVLQLTFDDVLEGGAGTALYAIRGGELRPLYRDGRATCRPAELVDLDGDSVPEFVVHSEDPADGDCGDTCHLILAERFGVYPGWLRVHRWRHDRLLPVEYEFPAYYGRLAAVYEKIHEWLMSDDPEALRCRGAYWLARDVNMFRRWSRRAHELSALGDGH